MPRLELDEFLQSRWILYDDQVLLCIDELDDCHEKKEDNPAIKSIASLVFIIAVGFGNPAPTPIVFDSQVPMVSGVIGSYQGSQKLTRPYVRSVISSKNKENNRFVGYSLSNAAYNGILEERNHSREETNMRMPANGISMNTIVYGTLSAVGLIAGMLAFIAAFITPLFDENIAYVLLPASFVYLTMIGSDYLARGRNHVRT